MDGPLNNDGGPLQEGSSSGRRHKARHHRRLHRRHESDENARTTAAEGKGLAVATSSDATLEPIKSPREGSTHRDANTASTTTTIIVEGNTPPGSKRGLASSVSAPATVMAASATRRQSCQLCFASSTAGGGGGGPPRPATFRCMDCRLDRSFFCEECREAVHNNPATAAAVGEACASDHRVVALPAPALVGSSSSSNDSSLRSPTAMSAVGSPLPPGATLASRSSGGGAGGSFGARTLGSPTAAAGCPSPAVSEIPLCGTLRSQPLALTSQTSAATTSGSMHGEQVAQLHDAQRDEEVLPEYAPGELDSLEVPDDQCAPDAWHFGQELTVAYVTWNLATEDVAAHVGPSAPHAAAAGNLEELLKPCAHVIAVGTQENGPYVGTGAVLSKWEATVDDYINRRAETRHATAVVPPPPPSGQPTPRLDDLSPSGGGLPGAASPARSPPKREPAQSMEMSDYLNMTDPASAGPPPDADKHIAPAAVADIHDGRDHHPYHRRRWRWHRVASCGMMATHLVVFAREDVFSHVGLVHTAFTKTGWVSGAFGNKGGVAVALAVCKEHMRPAPPPPASRPSWTATNAPGGAPATSASSEAAVQPAAVAEDPPPAYGVSLDDDHHHGGSGRAKKTRKESLRHPGPPSPPSQYSVSTKRFVSLLFLSAHLAPHQSHVEKRNADYYTIVSELAVGARGPYPSMARPSTPLKVDRNAPGDHFKRFNGARDCTSEFDYTFFGGDMNYRINGTKHSIEQIIHSFRSLRACLANNDQLTIERVRRRLVFQGFSEGRLAFCPTYKFGKNKTTGLYTDSYDDGPKQRLAAYCDRVLYRRHVSSSFATRHGIELLHYSDVPSIRVSDHKPVVALLRITRDPAVTRRPFEAVVCPTLDPTSPAAPPHPLMAMGGSMAELGPQPQLQLPSSSSAAVVGAAVNRRPGSSSRRPSTSSAFTSDSVDLQSIRDLDTDDSDRDAGVRCCAGCTIA